MPAALQHKAKLNCSNETTKPNESLFGNIEKRIGSPQFSSLYSPVVQKHPDLRSPIFNSPVSASPLSMSIVTGSTNVTKQALSENRHLLLSPVSNSGPDRLKDFSAPNFGNDYSNYFLHTKVLPQCWVRNVEEPLDGYPKLQQLHSLKKQHFAKHAHPAVGVRCTESRIAQTISEFYQKGAQFDVVMVGGCVDQFPIPKLRSMNIEGITARPSLLFLWVPSSEIAEGRQLMESWGFRRGEDITYLINSLDSKHAPEPNPWKPEPTLLLPTSWHCLMGLKGTLRRTSDTNLINCNVDTDVIIEKSCQATSIVPEQIYSVIENFTSMQRKLHIVPFRAPGHLPVRPRNGWVVLAPDTFAVGNFLVEKYAKRTLIPVDKEIDLLRPQTPPHQH